MPAKKLRTVRDGDFRGKRVLVRVDFNVPLDEGGRVSDDTRIKAALPTIRYLMGQDASVILVSHLGRPKGKPSPGLRMDPVARRLEELLGVPVRKADDCVGPTVEEAVKDLKPREVLILENVRFHPEEEKNDVEFARKLAGLAQAFVNDAFGAAHRAHASTEGVARLLPAYAGFLMEEELKALAPLVESPERPFTVVLGGAKISDKLGVLKNMVDKADRILLGGGMANTFISALGYATGDSLVEENMVDEARALMKRAKSKGVAVEVPEDLAIGDRFGPDAEKRVVEVGALPEGWMALDIGPRTVGKFSELIEDSRMVFWNGPVGVFEFERFAEGTVAIARAVSRAGEKGAHTVVGGGDSVAALRRAGIEKGITHVSTGGGASLEFVEGRTLPGVALLFEASS